MFRNIFFSVLIFLIAFIFRAYAVPGMHHVYYDEVTYFNIAENIYYHGSPVKTAMGDKNHIDIPQSFLRPNGYPYVLSFALKLFGDSEETAFHLNVFLGALSVVLIFWIAYLIFGNLNIAFWSSIIFNFLPAHLKYSTSGNADVTALSFILISLLLVLLYLNKRSILLLYFSIPMVAYSAYVKPENIVLYPLFFILLFFLYRTNKITKEDLILSVCWLGALIAPLAAKIPFMISGEQENAGGAFVSLKHLVKNIVLNVGYLFDFRFHSMVSTIFFIIGGVSLFIREKKKWLCLFCWFLIFFFLTSSYFLGMYSLLYSTDSDRHFLTAAVSFSILSGYGVHIFLEKKRKKVVFAVIILTLLIVNSIFATERIVNYTLQRDVYKEYRYIKESAKRIPNDKYVLTFQPFCIITLIDKKAMDMRLLPLIKNLPKEAVLLKGFWWFHDKKSLELYEKLLEKIYNFKTISERRVNSHYYGFYLLTSK